jgi:diguanylate cyclase (GGDEF)-like protein
MPLLHFDLLKTSLSINLNPSQQLLFFDSILEELTLYKQEIDLDSLGAEPIRIFAENPLIPGLIIRQQSQFIGMVSRRRFFEYMSRPYSLELFTKRPFSALYQFLQTDFLVLDSKTSIVAAVHQSLNRSLELIYEPLVVETLPGVFYVLDMEQLLLASSIIYELAMESLTESQLELVKQKSQLRATLESTADGILVVDRDNKIVNFNQKFIEMWNIPASIIATRDDSLALGFAMEQLKDPESFLSEVKELYSQPLEDSFDLLEFKDGRVFERYSQPEWLGENIVGRVWSFRDITQRKRMESALLQSEKTLRRHNRVLAKLTKSKTLNGKDLNHALREITEAAAQTLEVERVSVWLYNQDHSKIHCLDLYENSQGQHSEGVELAAVSYPAYFQALEHARAIAAHDAHTDSRTQEFSEFYLTPLGITSMLNAPIWLRGEMVGVLCYENVGLMRQWMLEEENFAAAIADLVSLSIETDKRKQAEETIRHQALHDHLTGLPNRTLFSDRLSIALANARRHKEMLAVVFLDLDRFKKINDTLGHDVGDLLLKAVVERVKDSVRQGDTVARWGGDEFTLLLPQIAGKKDATNIAQRILDALKPVFNLNGYEARISLSIGIAVYPFDGEDAETLVKNADVALYRTKEDGRNGYQVYSLTMNSQASELLAMENNLHQALERGEFVLHYQPQINIATGKITGMEALVRWQHPEFGLVSPATFIPLAEQTGLIVPIGEWVLWTACTQNKAWQDAGLPKLRMAVNLSARQFQQSNLIEIVERTLSETGLDPHYLELEVTESVTMRNLELAKTVLTNLYNMGIQLSMDDFGTGYSSLSYLKQFPFRTLKIDRSFVLDLTTNPKDAAIIAVIIALGKELNLRLIAEGVETEAQKDLLRCLQCEEMQGYLFSRPLPAKNATELLQQSGRGSVVFLQPSYW